MNSVLANFSKPMIVALLKMCYSNSGFHYLKYGKAGFPKLNFADP